MDWVRGGADPLRDPGLVLLLVVELLSVKYARDEDLVGRRERG